MNLKLTRISTVLCAALFLNACAAHSNMATYKNPNPAENNAKVSFETDFDLHTYFSVNASRNEQSCGKFESVGYLLKADSIFIYDKPNKEINITVPASRLIGVAGYHKYNDPGYRANCFPDGHFFVAQPNSKYIVKVNITGKDNGFCNISVSEVSNSGDRKQVQYVTPPLCKK
jgi:hypothetical protein